MKRERRAAPIQTADETTGRSFTARVLSYGAPDDFNTRWVPGVATEGLGQRMPTLAWGHDWSEPIGRAVSWNEDEGGLYMDFELDDPADVPRARQASAQLRSGTLKDVSVGFVRKGDRSEEDGSTTITKAVLDEVSLVLRGAVAGAEVLAVRSATAVDENLAVDASLVTDVAELLRTGAMDAEQARATLVAAARPVETPEETTLPLAPIEPSEVTPVPPGPPETPEAPPLEPGDPLEPVDPGPPVQPVKEPELEPDDDTAEMALALATIDTVIAGRA